jgi:uncharacterized protein (DUF697 family)
MSWLDSLEEVRRRDWAAAPRVEQDSTAREVVDICAYGGCLSAVVPIPLADLAILLPVHSVMVMTIGHVYGRSITQTEAKRIAVELGAVAGMSFAGIAALGALKRILLPGVGGLLSIPASFALTWGLGRVAIAYFADPTLSRDDLKRVFDEALREGRSVFSPEALERFRQKAAQAARDRKASTAAPDTTARASEPAAPARPASVPAAPAPAPAAPAPVPPAVAPVPPVVAPVTPPAPAAPPPASGRPKRTL